MSRCVIFLLAVLLSSPAARAADRLVLPPVDKAALAVDDVARAGAGEP